MNPTYCCIRNKRHFTQRPTDALRDRKSLDTAHKKRVLGADPVGRLVDMDTGLLMRFSKNTFMIFGQPMWGVAMEIILFFIILITTLN